MSARDHDSTQLRAELISKLTSEKYEAARVIVLTGGAGASGIANQLLDALDTPGAMNVLARTALLCNAVAAGEHLKSLVNGVLHTEALAEATREIDDAARLARDDPENCQAKNDAQAVALDKLQI